MLLIFAIPALGMVIYSGIYIFDKYEKLTKVEETELGILYVQKAELLLNNIQKERGLSAAYLGSNNQHFLQKLNKQKKESDTTIKTYLHFITQNNFNNSVKQQAIKEVQKELFELNELRQKTLNLQLSLHEELKAYNKITNAIIYSVSKLLIEEKEQALYSTLNALMNLIHAKEYAGLERARLSNILSKQKIESQEEYNKIIELIALQNSYLEKFKSSINIQNLDFYNNTLTHQVLSQLNEYRTEFYNIPNGQKIEKEPSKWWDISTHRINLLGKNIVLIMNQVLKQSSHKKNTITNNIYLTSLFSIIGLISLIISIIMFRKLVNKEHTNFFYLNKLKQLYNILSNTNELIVYDYNMQEVLNQTCLLAKKELDLSLSFVAMLNKNNQLEIVASNYNKDINCKDLELNRDNSIYQKVLFEKQHIIIDNINKDLASFDFTQEKKNNLQSIAIYPLFKDKEVIGLIGFCSQKKYYFDKQIISVFKKMSNDLSFGLNKEEKEKMRHDYEEQLRIASYAFDSQEAMAITDIDANLVRVNNAFTQITGYSKEEVLGQNPKILKSGVHDDAFYVRMWDCLLKEGYWSGELYNKRKNGEIYPEKTTITAIKNDKGETTHYIAQFFDITEIKENQEKLMYEIQHDSLTGLYNRVVLKERLKQSLSAASRHNHLDALLFLDLDNFKYVNDSLGHNVGDKLLKNIANTLTNLSREDDVVVRLGGDEFVILVHNVGETRQKAVVHVEQYAQRIIDALNQPVVIDNFTLTSTASIGVTFFPEENKDIDEIIKNADSAMYMAKRQGKNQIMFFYDDLDTQSKHYLRVENELRTALKNNEFELYYQAQFDQSKEKIIGYEALLRWNHPTKGVLTPFEFIHIAEESGLIIPIGKWVFENACHQINQWLNEKINLDDIRISINISSLELEQIDFVDNIKKSLELTQTNPIYLELEITESNMFRNIDLVIEKIRELKSLGITCAIDDFGVGFSSLSYISKLPVNTIKLDQSFIMNKNISVNEAIIDMVIRVTKELNINLIIEGVEDQKDIEYLRQKGNFIYQGYHISYPITANKAITLLEKGFLPYHKKRGK